MNVKQFVEKLYGDGGETQKIASKIYQALEGLSVGDAKDILQDCITGLDYLDIAFTHDTGG